MMLTLLLFERRSSILALSSPPMWRRPLWHLQSHQEVRRRLNIASGGSQDRFLCEAWGFRLWGNSVIVCINFPLQPVNLVCPSLPKCERWAGWARLREDAHLHLAFHCSTEPPPPTTPFCHACVCVCVRVGALARCAVCLDPCGCGAGGPRGPRCVAGAACCHIGRPALRGPRRGLLRTGLP